MVSYIFGTHSHISQSSLCAINSSSSSWMISSLTVADTMMSIRVNTSSSQSRQSGPKYIIKLNICNQIYSGQ